MSSGAGLISTKFANVALILAIFVAPLFARIVSSNLRTELIRDIQACRTTTIDELFPSMLSVDQARIIGWGLCAYFAVASMVMWLAVGISSWVYALLFIPLLILSLVDLDVQLLPGYLVGTVLWGGIFSSLLNLIAIPVEQSILGVGAGWTLFSIPQWALRITRPKQEPAVGQGDVSLLAACGAWMGPEAIILTGCGAIVLALITRFILNQFSEEYFPKTFPFGPFIATAAIFVLCFNSLPTA